MRPILALLSCIVFMEYGYARVPFIPKQYVHYNSTASIALPPYPTSPPPSSNVSSNFPPNTTTGPTGKTTPIQTPPFCNRTSSACGNPLHPRGTAMPTFLPSGSGGSVVPTGKSRPFLIKTPPYSNHTAIIGGRLLNPRDGTAKPSFLPSGTGGPIIPTGDLRSLHDYNRG